VTYKQIAHALGTKAYRAVGMAMKKNNSSEVPCHRVINSDGKIGGFNKGINKKIKMLKEEGIAIKNNKIDLNKYRFNLNNA
jgi:methylated-DNA-[protein]-cysteine S-methyltransferase